MSEHISYEIPKMCQRWHSSSAAVAKSKTNGGSSLLSIFYCWPSFDGYVYYVSSPLQSQMSLNPTIRLYVNDECVASETPSKTEVGDGHIYEVLFNGLSYNDQYYITADYGDGEASTPIYKYIGQKGYAPMVRDDGTAISSIMHSPYDKSYSMSVGVITFDSDYGELNSYSREARDLLYITNLQNTEYDAVLGKVGNYMSYWVDRYDEKTNTFGQPNKFTTEATLCRFDKWSKSIRVGIATKSATYRSIFSSYVNSWIKDTNTLIGRTLFVRDDSVTEDDDDCIRITIGTHQQLWGYTPGDGSGHTDFFYGRWSCTRWYPDTRGIAHCEVQLCNELRGAITNTNAFKDITYEELTQALGCGNDTYSTYESMFSQIWYIGKKNRLLSSNLPTIDGEVVKMLYNEFEGNEPASEVIFKLTPSVSACIQLPMNPKRGVIGKGYSIKAYAMNRFVTWVDDEYYWNSSNNCFSNIGRSIHITLTQIRPKDFSWTYPKVRGGAFNLTAQEWTDFTNRINAFRNYCGLNFYNFSQACKDCPFTAAMYRQAREAIQDINGYGTHIPYVTSGDIIKADMMNILVSELNSIP